MAMRAKASLLFCPPESEAIGLIANSPVTPKEPRYDRYSSSFIPEGKSNKMDLLLHVWCTCTWELELYEMQWCRLHHKLVHVMLTEVSYLQVSEREDTR